MLRGFFYLFFTPESSVGCLQPLHPQLTDWSSFAHPVASLGRSWLFAPPCPNASHLVDTAGHTIVILPLCRSASFSKLSRPSAELEEFFHACSSLLRHEHSEPFFLWLFKGLFNASVNKTWEKKPDIVRLGVVCWLVENNETSINASQFWFHLNALGTVIVDLEARKKLPWERSPDLWQSWNHDLIRWRADQLSQRGVSKYPSQGCH